MLRAVGCAFVWALLISTAFAQGDEFLDECEDKGRLAGRMAMRVACAKMKAKCPVPATRPPPPSSGVVARSGASGEHPIDVDALLQQVIRESCIELFDTTCRNAAIERVFETGSRRAGVTRSEFADLPDPDCAAILTDGPGDAATECSDQDAAAKIFDDALKLCKQVPKRLVQDDQKDDQKEEQGEEEDPPQSPQTPQVDQQDVPTPPQTPPTDREPQTPPTDPEPNPVSDPEPSPGTLQVDDPCACAEDGLSDGVTAMGGCEFHSGIGFGKICYVVGGGDCGSAIESDKFPGARWKRC